GNVILARILESWRLRWRRLGWSRYPEFWPCRSRRHGHRRCRGPAADRDEAPDRRNTVPPARETSFVQAAEHPNRLSDRLARPVLDGPGGSGAGLGRALPRTGTWCRAGG